jgi:DNA-binding Lrp family transcriptional regulator
LQLQFAIRHNDSVSIDSVDQQILEILQVHGRITNAELASRVGLTPGPVLARVNKLEENGFISSYRAVVDQDRIGLGLTAFAAVILHSHGSAECDAFIAAMRDVPEVLECHHIAGDEDYLIKVVASSPADYERLLLDRITGLKMVRRVKTLIVLSTPKSTSALPIRKEP